MERVYWSGSWGDYMELPTRIIKGVNSKANIFWLPRYFWKVLMRDAFANSPGFGVCCFIAWVIDPNTRIFFFLNPDGSFGSRMKAVDKWCDGCKQTHDSDYYKTVPVCAQYFSWLKHQVEHLDARYNRLVNRIENIGFDDEEFDD